MDSVRQIQVYIDVGECEGSLVELAILANKIQTLISDNRGDLVAHYDRIGLLPKITVNKTIVSYERK